MNPSRHDILATEQATEEEDNGANVDQIPKVHEVFYYCGSNHHLQELAQHTTDEVNQNGIFKVLCGISDRGRRVFDLNDLLECEEGYRHEKLDCNVGKI